MVGWLLRAAECRHALEGPWEYVTESTNTNARHYLRISGRKQRDDDRIQGRRVTRLRQVELKSTDKTGGNCPIVGQASEADIMNFVAHHSQPCPEPRRILAPDPKLRLLLLALAQLALPATGSATKAELFVFRPGKARGQLYRVAATDVAALMQNLQTVPLKGARNEQLNAAIDTVREAQQHGKPILAVAYDHLDAAQQSLPGVQVLDHLAVLQQGLAVRSVMPKLTLVAFDSRRVYHQRDGQLRRVEPGEVATIWQHFDTAAAAVKQLNLRDPSVNALASAIRSQMFRGSHLALAGFDWQLVTEAGDAWAAMFQTQLGAALQTNHTHLPAEGKIVFGRMAEIAKRTR